MKSLTGSFCKGLALGVVLATGVVSPAFGQGGAEAKAATQSGKKPAKLRASKAASGALADARAILATAKGTKGDARKAVLQRAVQAMEKVATDFSAEPGSAAPAHFAAASVWRSLGDTQKAIAGFKKAAELNGSVYGARSALELAHLERRANRLPEARKLYTVVVQGEPKSARGHQARLWIARCFLSEGKVEDGVAAFRAAVTGAGTPRQKIEACNRLASQLVKMKDLEGAEKVIASAAAAAKIKPPGKGAERALKNQAKAYAQMSARRALQRARDKSGQAAGDAKDIEKNGAKKSPL